MQRKPITAKGKILLSEKLKNLREVKLPSVLSDLAEARAKGDLSENFEYHAAKTQKSQIEDEIRSLDEYLNSAVVYEAPESPTEVCFGSKVKFEVRTNAEEKRIVEYIIVGDKEDSVERGSISFRSPLFAKIVGQKPGYQCNIAGNEYLVVSVTKPTQEELSSSIFVKI